MVHAASSIIRIQIWILGPYTGLRIWILFFFQMAFRILTKNLYFFKAFVFVVCYLLKLESYQSSKIISL
jgi:hypothetical protein